ncbi:putative bifunctional diguanylate cyclase/phosphodiesterase [Legionella spiritensis]|uniref:Diguanylate cyclase/phosphodiesterase domain 2 n=1 Tax=Legionella spiritensis TaxID=452 RepID=A0A0W0ZA35_LEGSP|nr:EAL domain-containing protein [Legionella spiritensis]KTD65919.1 diguanylate cyclase/phosphodiesterase domain 2 [Legionella spiritensis]SNV31834.1 diguanylate cyclase/phosphodiesterase domain-containing protein [Legionella spiritensis]
MDNIKFNLENNARLLKSKVSGYAILGLVIALIAIFSATLAVSYQMTGAISLQGIIQAQKSNIALIILDLTPILFMFWGQSLSSVMSYTASAMVMDQTNELRMQTSELTLKAQHESSHDALTDLPNRVLFTDRLNQALTAMRGSEGKIAVILININNFKELNAGFGSYNSDRILKQFAQRLKCTIEEPMTLARMGGDEFAILYPNVETEKDIRTLVKKLQKAIAINFALEGVTIDATATIGLTMYPEHGKDDDTLIQRANIAVYHAKQHHKDFVIYQSFMERECPNKLILMSELKKAIDSEQLLVHFQPKVELSTGKIKGCEALLRWNHPTFGMMSAEKFIPVAERTGLIKTLSQYVLKHAIESASTWRKSGIDIELSINLSTIDIIDIELPYTIESLLSIYEYPASLLKVEIIESAYLTDHDRAVEVINRLAALGVKISIDDFGTGYSSFIYLTVLPITELKIDKSFITSIHEDSKKHSIVDAIIKLAGALNLNVVAEGVESEQHFSMLRSLGCLYGQGFYFSEAIDRAGILELVKNESYLPLKTTENQNTAKVHIVGT